MGYHLHNRATAAHRAAKGDDWFTRPDNYLYVPFAAAGSLTRALLQLDMAYDVSDYCYQTPNTWTGTSGRPPFAFPDPAGYELTSYQDPDGMIIWDGPRLAEFQAERTRVLALHLPRERPGIPIHKLGTPEGWVVDRNECAAAVTVYRRHRDHGARPPHAFGDAFVTFLAACADGDGFTVT